MAAAQHDSRQRVYDAVRTQIEASGSGNETVISVVKSAASVDLSGTAFTGHLKKLCDEGRLVWVGSSRQGTRVALPAGGAPAPAEPEPPAAQPEPEVAAAAEPVAGSARGPALRSQILDYLRSRVSGVEHEVLLSTGAIADAIGANANNVAYHLSRLVRAGEIDSRSAGSRGTWFRLGGPAGKRVRAAAAPAAAPAGTKGAVHFCPFCGSKAQGAEWRFCAHCGEALPR